MTATLTQRYTDTHLAILDANRTAGIPPTAARIILAVAERGGTATSTQIVHDLLGADVNPSTAGSNVRRGLRILYDKQLATSTGWWSTAAATVTLTPAGQVLADRMTRHAKGHAT